VNEKKIFKTFCRWPPLINTRRTILIYDVEPNAPQVQYTSDGEKPEWKRFTELGRRRDLRSKCPAATASVPTTNDSPGCALPSSPSSSPSLPPRTKSHPPFKMPAPPPSVSSMPRLPSLPWSPRPFSHCLHNDRIRCKQKPVL
jgi:hypothetical protein